MIQISDQHLLEGDAVTFMNSPDVGGELVPELVVVHFTAGGTAGGSAKWLTKRDEHYVSAHLVIGRGGEVFQLVPFNRVAYHAGRSSWRGRGGCNSFALGIELANYGGLETVDEKYYSWSGQEVPADRVWKNLKHKHGGPVRAWESFPPAQVERCAELVAAMLDRYPAVGQGVVEVAGPNQSAIGIVGHDDIAPGRKVDPGPAWIWREFSDRLDTAKAKRRAAA